MLLIIIFSIVGGIAGVIGAIVLAFGLSSVLLTLKNHAIATDVTIDFLLKSHDVPVFTGWDEAYSREFSKAKQKTTAGVFCIVAGFLLQSVSVLIQALS